MLGIHNHCRQCQSKLKKEWYNKNRERELKKSALYKRTQQAKEARLKRYADNKNKFLERNRVRRRTEKSKIQTRIQRNKWMQDPKNRIGCLLRGRIRSALNGITKCDSLLGLLGCTVDELKKYLESKFTDGMCWENYGVRGWHIDHVVACAKFDLSNLEEQRKCFHYSNLQPLWWHDNLSKWAN